jgi:hypothetical protein
MFPVMHFEKGRVKWSHPKKPFCILTMESGRDVFLHQNDFAGEWPPRYYKLIRFEAVETPGQKCPFKALNAEVCGGGQ